ncbi:MAG: zinc ribbon domain-containing protein [Ilumatobacteraceae bacterium]
MSVDPNPLLDLQAAETLVEQLRHRRDHLTERDQVESARRAVAEVEQRHRDVRARIDELQAVVDDAERRTAELDATRTRLSAQLRTVIAPREAEALQSEIAAIDAARSELDDAGLEAMEEQVDLVDRVDEYARDGAGLRDRQRAAEEALERAVEVVEGERAAIVEGLEALRAAVAPALLERYDRLRRNQVVAAARLEGSRCTGCHLDLSAAELGEVRAAAAEAVAGVTDCPHCGRMLVV